MGLTCARRPLGAVLAVAALLLTAYVPTAVTAAGSEPRPEEQGSVDVNTATVEDLMAVQGIGPSLAQRIVEFREKNGPFKTLDDLLKVQGIGEKSLAKLRDRLAIGKPKK